MPFHLPTEEWVCEDCCSFWFAEYDKDEIPDCPNCGSVRVNPMVKGEKV